MTWLLGGYPNAAAAQGCPSRKRRARWLAVWCAVVVVAFPSAATQRPTPRDVALQRYMELLEAYRKDPATAVSTIRGWTDTEVSESSSVFQDRVIRTRKPSDVPAAFTAVMLHTDAAVKKALADNNTSASLHLLIATSILDLLRRQEPMERQFPFTAATWHLAVVRVLNALFDWDVEQLVLQTGRSEEEVQKRIRELADMAEREHAGAGAQMLLAMASLEDGSVHMARQLWQFADESQGDLIVGTSRAWTTPRRSSGPSEASLRRSMAHAGELYRLALEQDGALLEARLRLGHLLFESGRPAEAREELRQVLSIAKEPRHLYLACLFLGQMEEQDGYIDEALKLYDRALAAWPGSQTARIALASAHERLGDVEAARTSMLPFLDWYSAGSGRPDPWGVYFMGESNEGFLMLDEMRRKVTDAQR